MTGSQRQKRSSETHEIPTGQQNDRNLNSFEVPQEDHQAQEEPYNLGSFTSEGNEAEDRNQSFTNVDPGPRFLWRTFAGLIEMGWGFSDTVFIFFCCNFLGMNWDKL